MVFNPAIPEIATVTSESLQAKVRALLPSQDGFGTDLAAQNVIVPIIDLTAAAEGSDVPVQLQESLGFSDVTRFKATGSTETLANVPGFYLITWQVSIEPDTGAVSGTIRLTNGGVSKQIIQFEAAGTGSGTETQQIFGQNRIFLAAGDSCEAVSNNSQVIVHGCIRQIASSTGVLSNPTGFTPE
jgi:hypothetical protein